jgi:hypothetical protein
MRRQGGCIFHASWNFGVRGRCVVRFKPLLLYIRAYGIWDWLGPQIWSGRFGEEELLWINPGDKTTSLCSFSPQLIHYTDRDIPAPETYFCIFRVWGFHRYWCEWLYGLLEPDNGFVAGVSEELAVFMLREIGVVINRSLMTSLTKDLYSSPNTVRVIKSRISWAGHAARMGKNRGVYRFYGGETWGKETTWETLALMGGQY